MTTPTASLASAISGAGFDAADIGEIRVTFGDANRDGTVDLRVRVFGKIPILHTEPHVLLHAGPFNVPVTQALQVASSMVAVMPAPAAPIASAVLGAAAGLSGGLQRLLLLPPSSKAASPP